MASAQPQQPVRPRQVGAVPTANLTYPANPANPASPAQPGTLASTGIALLLGAGSTLSFAPWGLWPLLPLLLAGLLALARSSPQPLAAARLGAAYGLGAFGSGVSWVHVSLSVFGGLAAPLAALATLAFCSLLAVFPALALAAWRRWRPVGLLRQGLSFAAWWMLAECLRGYLFTGFPWLAIGYSQTPPSPLAGYAPLLGVYGVSLLTALAAGLLLLALSPLRLQALRAANEHAQRSPAADGPGAPCLFQVTSRRAAGLALLALAALYGGGTLLRHIDWSQPDGQPIRVALLQGNIAQEMKWRPERLRESLQVYAQLMHDHPAQLTVLPETALPTFYQRLPAEYLAHLRQLAARQQGEVLLGIAAETTSDITRNITASGNAEPAYTNSAISLGQAPEQRYSKVHLVPFGERIPPGFGWFLRLVNIPLADFSPGATTQPPLALLGQQIAVNICYEDLFGEEIIRALPAASLLVNLSNTAWFGDSLAQPQHLQIARMRALETARPMLRATNTGMTALIAANGEVVQTLPAFTRGALEVTVQGRQGSTPYVRLGNLAALLLALGLLLFGARKPTSVRV